MDASIRRLAACSAVALCGAVLAGCEAPRLRMAVNSAADGADASPGDERCEASPGQGDCTLRAAIEEANAIPTLDVITIGTGIEPVVGGPPPVIDSSVDLRGKGATFRHRIVHRSGNLTLRDVTVTGVTVADGCGAGISSDGPVLNLLSVRVVGNVNEGSGNGGGVCSSGVLTMLGSTIEGNRVAGQGGGIHASGSLVVLGSLVAANIAEGNGGGIAVADGGTLTLATSTVNGNSASSGASGLSAPTATGRIVASTVSELGVALDAGITVSGSVLGDCEEGGMPTSGGYNAIAESCGAPAPTDLVGGALDGLADNGGPTATRLPIAGSALLDAVPAGTPLLCDGSIPVDQRGRARPAHGGCDIGAVELQSSVRPGNSAFIGSALGRAIATNASGTVVGEASPIGSPENSPVRWHPDGRLEVLRDAVDVRDVNDDGVAVGRGVPATGWSRAYLWEADGEPLDLGTLPGDVTSQATAVNNRGVVVGMSTGMVTGTRPWWRDPVTGTLTALPSLGGRTSAIESVNDEGVAVGWSEGVFGQQRAARWELRTGEVTDLGLIDGAASSRATAINDDGVIVGILSRPDLGEYCLVLGLPACPDTRAFEWDPTSGTMREIPGIGGPLATPVAVDERGRVLLTVEDPTVYCGFCWEWSTRAYLRDLATGENILLRGPYPADLDGDALVGYSYDYVFVPFRRPARLELYDAP